MRTGHLSPPLPIYADIRWPWTQVTGSFLPPPTPPQDPSQLPVSQAGGIWFLCHHEIVLLYCHHEIVSSPLLYLIVTQQVLCAYWGTTMDVQKVHWNLTAIVRGFYKDTLLSCRNIACSLDSQALASGTEVPSTPLTTRWQSFPASGLAEAHIPDWCFLNPASVSPEASGKRSFTKETFTKDKNSRIKYSETEELEEENTISQHHVLTQPSLQQKFQQFCAHLQSGVELELPSIPASSESTFLYPFVPLKARYWCLKTRYISFII